MAITKPVPVRPDGKSIVLSVLAVAVGVLLLGRATVQGIGAALFWGPCWSDGYESAACNFLQYEAPAPAWFLPFWVWFVDVFLALVVIAGCVVVGRRLGTAWLALLAVLASSVLIDLIFTPMINGGYSSADEPPGFGLIGAGFLAVGGVVMFRVAVPYRRSLT